MATNMNYDSLKTDVERYLERGSSAASDPAVFAQIPRLINAAERKIMQSLKLQGSIESLTDPAGFTNGVSVIAKPDRWRLTISMFYGTGTGNSTRTPVFPRSYEYCRSYWPDPTVTGPPEFYSDYTLQSFLIVPTPNQTYSLELMAYMQPELLDAANQENFFTVYCGNLILYSTLLEAEPYLKNDSRVPLWKEYRDFELATLGGQDLQKIMDRAAERQRA